MEQKKTQKTFLLVVVCIIVVVLVVFLGKTNSTPQAPVSENTTLGIQVTAAPWIAEIAHLKERLASIGLPALPEEGTTLHIHQHLDIFVHGKPVAVSPGIGINEQDRFIAPIHTHDASNVIHVESPTVQDFTLGQFFDIWGVQFTANAIGGYTSDATNTLTVFVNGKEFAGDPRTLILAPHQEIVVTFGTKAEIPNPVPSSYTFSDGE